MARLIYGIRRSALRQESLKAVAAHMNQWPDRRSLLIVPEQSKMDMEQDLLSFAKQDSLMLAEVLSFRRLAFRLLGETGAQPLQRIDRTGQAVLLQKILKQEKSKLHRLADLADKPGFIQKIASVMGDLKRYQIQPVNLLATAEGCTDIALAHKMADFAILLQAYDQSLSEAGLSDAENDITMLADQLEQLADRPDRLRSWPYKQLTWLRKASIWVSGFAETRGFTPQEMRVLKALDALCASLTLTAAAEKIPAGKEDLENGPDFFLPGRRAVWQLVTQLNIKERIFISADKQLNRQHPAMLLSEALLEQASPIRLNQEKESDEKLTTIVTAEKKRWLNLVQAPDIDQEVKWAAGLIRQLVQCDGYRYQDLVIAACNMPLYASRLQAACRIYQIPVFLDRERSLAGTVLLRFVLSLLDIQLTGWSRQAVMSCLRTGLLEEDSARIDQMENDMLRRGLFRADRVFSTRLDHAETADPDFPQWRDQILKPIRQVLRQLGRAAGSAEKCQVLQRYLLEQQIPEQLTARIDSLTNQMEMDEATVLAQSWNELDRLLHQIVILSDNQPVSLKTFRDYLNAAVSSAQTGVIPSAVDQISIGDLRRGLLRQPRVLIILGASAGQLPPAWPPEGLLKDQEREEIARQLDCELPSHTRDQAFADQFMIYTLLTLPESHLFLSCPGQDRSPWFRKLAEMYPDKLLNLSAYPGLDDVRLYAPEPALSAWLMWSNAATKSNRSSRADNNKTKISSSDADHVNNQTNFHDNFSVSPDNGFKWDILGQLLRRHLGQSALNPQGPLSGQTAILPSNLLRISTDQHVMSVSQLEQYASCPFRHLGLSLLHLRERDQYQPQAAETGTLLHGIAEQAILELQDDYSRLVTRNKTTWQALLENWLARDFISEAERWMKKTETQTMSSVFSDQGLYASAGRRARIMAARSIEAMLKQLAVQAYQPQAVEWRFGPEQSFHYEINKDAKQFVAFRGIIDRIDLAETDEGTLFRIIDYKSGSKGIDYDRLYYGLDLQLAIYLDVCMQNYPDWQAAEAGYFHFDSPLLRLEYPDLYNPEAVAKKLLSQFNLKSIKADPATMQALGAHGRKKAATWAEAMHRGDFSARPARLRGGQPACIWCNFQAVCGFHERNGLYRWYQPLDSQSDLAGKSKKEKFLGYLEANLENRQQDRQQEGGNHVRK